MRRMIGLGVMCLVAAAMAGPDVAMAKGKGGGHGQKVHSAKGNAHGKHKAKAPKAAKSKAVRAAPGLGRVIEVRGRSFDLDDIARRSLAPLALAAIPDDVDAAPVAPPIAEVDPETGLGPVATYRQALLDYRVELNDPDRLARQEDDIRGLIALAGPEVGQDALADAARDLYALDDDGRSWSDADRIDILRRLAPTARPPEIMAALDATDGIVGADNRLKELDSERDRALATALSGRRLVPDSPEWEQFHAMLRLDEELSEDELAALDSAEVHDRIADLVPSIDEGYARAVAD